MYPLVRELAAGGIPVAVTCRVLGIARQPYDRWLAVLVTDAELESGVCGFGLQAPRPATASAAATTAPMRLCMRPPRSFARKPRACCDDAILPQ